MSIDKFHSINSNVFLTAFVRSRHWHLAHSMRLALGYIDATTAGLDGHGNDEHVINPHAAIVLFRRGAQVFDQHSRASTNNVSWLDAYEYKVKVVVMFRNLLDTLYNVKALMDSGGFCPGAPGAKNWSELSDQEKMTWIASNVTPWLLSFYVSWMESDLKKVVVWHEDYDRDRVGVLRRVISDVDLKMPLDAVLKRSVAHSEGPQLGSHGDGDRLSDIHKEIVLSHVDSWGTEWAERMREDLFR